MRLRSEAKGRTIGRSFDYAASDSRDNEDEVRQAKMLTKDEARPIAINITRLSELLGKAGPDQNHAALRAQFNRDFAPSPSSGRPMSELTCTGDTWGLLKWKAERSEHRAIGKKQRDTPNWPILANAISRALCTKGLRSDLLAWPRIWSVSGVSELVGASYTENRKACRSRLIFVDVAWGQSYRTVRAYRRSSISTLSGSQPASASSDA